jgi:hypothetical protein
MPADSPKTSDADDPIIRVLMEIFGASHRAGAIVAAAQVEDVLARAILSRMCKMTRAEEKLLLVGASAPMGTFYAKIHIGYALGLFSDSVRDDLGIIKDIRNLFAHEIGLRDFNDPMISALCRKFNFPHSIAGKPQGLRLPVNMDDPRDVFERTSTHLYHMLQLYQNKLLSPQPPSWVPINYPFRPNVRVTPQKKSSGKTIQ